MHEVFYLSMDLAYSETNHQGHYFTARGDLPTDIEDKVFGYADGLVHSYLERMMNGRCSLNAMAEFDIAAFEDEVKKDIETFTTLLAKIGKPRRLTVEEMRGRGYIV